MSQTDKTCNISTIETTPTSNDWRIRPPGLWSNPEEHFNIAAEHAWYRLVTAVNGSILESTHRFYLSRNIMPVLMPITVGSVSSPMGLGSDSLPVEIDLQGDRTYLADSMQFQLEFMLRHGLHGAYYVMPTFRGETADSTHLNQFFHSEAEILGDLDAVIQLVESYMAGLTNGLLSDRIADNLQKSAGTTQHLEQLLRRSEFPRITYADAQDLLGSAAFTTKLPGAPAITRQGELGLIKHYGGAVWLTLPPSRSVPFYQRVDDHGRAQSADLLLGVGEVVGCGARHITGQETRRALANHIVAESEYSWYVKMKDRYPLETSGFGLGLERFLLWVLRHDDIRDIHVLPRVIGTHSWL